MTTKQLLVSSKSGIAVGTTCPVTVASLSAGDAIVHVPGANPERYEVELTAVGTDHPTDPVTFPQSGFVGSVLITGLPEWLSDHPYTVTQNGNTESFVLQSAPASNQDFAFVFASCDNCDNWSGRSGWEGIMEYAKNPASLPMAGVIFSDDHGYADWNPIDDTAGTGLASAEYPTHPVAATTVSEFDYTLNYLAHAGLLSPSKETLNFGSDNYWGNDEARRWCFANLNYMPQWGDHEFSNDIGWDDGSRLTKADIWAAGKAAWDAFMAPLQQPAYIKDKAGARDTSSYHLGFELGCVKFAMPEYRTNGDGLINESLPQGQTGTTQFGNDHIDDILDELNTDHPFKILGMVCGVRELNGDPGNTNSRRAGTQQALANYNTDEYARLMTRNAVSPDPESLMQNRKTNGSAGNLIALYGDHHCLSHQEHRNLTGDNPEHFDTVQVGSITGTFAVTASTVGTGTVYNGTTIKMLKQHQDLLTYPRNSLNTCVFEVYGSEDIPRIVLRIYDGLYNEWYTREWSRSPSGNTSNNEGEKPGSAKGVSVGI
jgi:hypothetical protein